MRGQFPKLVMRDVPLRGKTVLLRVDYNVPLTRKGAVADDFRIRMSVPTVRALLDQGCKVVVISHLGRPEGKVVPALSLEPAALRLAELLDEPVRFVDRCIGPRARMAVKRAPRRSVIVLENLRFHPEETANSPKFARELAAASGASLFVQDGFGVVHRAHASTSAITMELPSVAGLLLEREYLTITRAMQRPARPFVAVLGGAKVSDKIGVIEALIDVADTIIIGGAMANTFLATRGTYMAASKVEADQKPIVDAIYEKAIAKVGRKHVDDFLVLPVDVGVGRSLEPHATRQESSVRAIPAGTMALDLGPRSVKKIAQIVKKAHTVIWNGPLGYSEIPAFATASANLAQLLADSPKDFSIVGGGDTADFAINWDPRHGDSFDHVSTGGGATLELMSGKSLPGIDALLDAR